MGIRCSSLRFFGGHVTKDLAWTLNTTCLLLILSTFYRRTTETILTSCLTAWYGNHTVSYCKTLQRTVKTAEKDIMDLSTTDASYQKCCICKANSIVDEPSTLSWILPC